MNNMFPSLPFVEMELLAQVSQMERILTIHLDAPPRRRNFRLHEKSTFEVLQPTMIWRESKGSQQPANYALYQRANRCELHELL